MCPKAIIQGAHFGNPWYDEAAEVCRWSPNVFFDITGSTLHKLIKLNDLERFSKVMWWTAGEGEATQHTLKGGPDAFEHIVFGTDENPTGLAPNIERFQKFLEANKVPEATREKMWGLQSPMSWGLIRPPRNSSMRAPSPPAAVRCSIPPGSAKGIHTLA